MGTNRLNLPASGLLRARTRITGDYGNGSSGLLESRASFSFSPPQLWRQEQFGTMENAGNAANNADPDQDGLHNLVEFAFGGDPNHPDNGILPEWERDDDDYVLSFNRPANVNGVSYVAEYSTTLAPGNWTQASNAGTASSYLFLAPAVNHRLFLRVRVTVP